MPVASRPSVRDVRLETPRLILREYTPADASAVLRYASDSEVLRYRMATPATLKEVESSLARIDGQRHEEPLRTRYELAVETRADQRVIGWLPLLLSGKDDLNDAEIGWTLERDAWGQGYATEAARAALSFAFETLRLHRVWARCQPENTPSARIMEKIGLRREGHFRQCQYVKGRWIDALHYAMLDEEWWALRRGSLPTRPRGEITDGS
jgi:ribosomal-protein-alanine N-acetyltransferase